MAAYAREVIALLEAPRLRLEQLQAATFMRGSPDELRGPVWKALLGYLPLERRERAAHLAAFRGQYRDWVREISAPAAPAAALAVEVADAAGDAAGDALSLSASNVFGSPTKHGSLRASVEDVNALFGDAGGDSSATAAPPLLPRFDDDHGMVSGGSRADAVDGSGAAAGAAAGASSVDAAAVGLDAAAEALAGGAQGGVGAGAMPVGDPPPPLSPSAVAAAAAEDELLQSIQKDVERTFSELAFFAVPDGAPPSSNPHIVALGSILLVYAKTNAGVRYVQGMSELAAVFLYVCVTDKWPVEGVVCSLEDAEADAFFLFASLMAEHRDVFIQANDESHSGIKGQIEAFGRLLTRREPSVSAHLSRLRLMPEYYALRWLTTLCCREFTFPDTLLLWDSLLADSSRFSFHRHACVAMVRLQRNTLLNADFSACMKLLQRYPPIDFLELLAAAMEVRAEENAERHSAAAMSHVVRGAAAASSSILHEDGVGRGGAGVMPPGRERSWAGPRPPSLIAAVSAGAGAAAAGSSGGAQSPPAAGSSTEGATVGAGSSSSGGAGGGLAGSARSTVLWAQGLWSRAVGGAPTS